jgi:hypothetical protein
MTPEDVIREISQKATGMVSRGEVAHVVRVGRVQAEALRQGGGHTGNTLTVAAPIIAPQIFTGPGEDNPVSMFGNVSLQVERTSDESRLEVL